MTTKPSIKTDLFRLITMRTPEQLSQQTRSLRFVQNPYLEKSLANSCPVPPANVSSTAAYDNYLKQYKGFTTYQEARALHPALYDFANQAIKKKWLIADVLAQKIPRTMLLSATLEARLFDQLYYQVLTKANPYVRQAVSQMLVLNHIIKQGTLLTDNGIKRVTDIKIEIPQQILLCYKRWTMSGCGGEMHGVTTLGIADFRRVEQEVCCYVPGEVSHIENIMAREYKERNTRNLLRTETSTEISNESEVERISDVSTTTRNELGSEIANVLEEERSTNYGASLGVTGKWLGAEITADAYADFATNNSASYSDKETRKFAEEVTKKAVERLVQRTSEKRTARIIKEFEENTRHGYDNRNGDAHVTGIYRWIDIIYKNRLVNYGRRLMLEFMVPNPAEFYERIRQYVPAADSSDAPTGSSLMAPETLASRGIHSFSNITRENYANLAAVYGINIPAPLPNKKTVTQSFAPTPEIKHNGPDWTRQGSIPIEPDYEAERIDGTFNFRWRATAGEKAHFSYRFGNVANGVNNLRGREQTYTGAIGISLQPTIRQSVPVVFSGDKLFTYQVSVNVTCVLSPHKFADWQQNAYRLLQDAYNKELDEYKRQLALEQSQRHEDKEEQDAFEPAPENPAMLRQIEQRELKRVCLEMLMRPFCRTQGTRNYTDYNACDRYLIPMVNQNRQYANYAAQTKFFEQAIDWKLMSYLFYPYFWADKCEWGNLMKRKHNDPVFESFLQSGMARVVVPVTPVFTDAMIYYMGTGDIWLGNDLVPGTDDDLFLSITEEMQTVEGTVEDEWETRVPTNLAIIQGRSAYLDESGLPCCHEVNGGSVIAGSDNILQLLKEQLKG